MKIQGQGHDENRPKSNQVIYRSGPTIVPKMKEIQKGVQKFSRGQSLRRRTNRYKNIVIPPVYRGDLMSEALYFAVLVH